jgi:hypothetical protein
VKSCCIPADLSHPILSTIFTGEILRPRGHSWASVGDHQTRLQAAHFLGQKKGLHPEEKGAPQIARQKPGGKQLITILEELNLLSFWSSL